MAMGGSLSLPWFSPRYLQILQGYLLQGFHFLREEVETVTRQDPLVPLFPTGIVVQRHYQVDAILEILMDDLDPRRPPVEQYIESISTRFWMQAHAVSCLH